MKDRCSSSSRLDCPSRYRKTINVKAKAKYQEINKHITRKLHQFTNICMNKCSNRKGNVGFEKESRQFKRNKPLKYISAS